MPKVVFYERTYSLKTKDGLYTWIFDYDGSERFPGITFSSPKEAEEYHAKLYGRTYFRIEPKT